MKLVTPSILITDDDRDFRETLGGLFEPRGFRTFLAGDGEEALDIIRREQVHLALFDMHMPRLTGLEAMRRLRELELQAPIHSLPCILISAALDPMIVQEAREQNVFTVLAKPIGVREVTAAVHKALEQAYQWLPEGR
ncbi:MAG: response regulator [Pirellulales bacterium]